jgi:hypothetical protein
MIKLKRTDTEPIITGIKVGLGGAALALCDATASPHL